MRKGTETDRIDVRTLQPAVREQLRRTALRLHKQGHTQEAIATALGVRRPTVSQWLKRARAGLGVKEARRGRPLGDGRTLTAAQEERLRRDITEGSPDQLRLRFALWSAQAVRALIKQHFGIDMPVRTVRNDLKRWGFTPQCPLRRAYEQKPEAVERWLKEQYPALAARAKAEGGEIHWADATAVSSIAHERRGYAPKGQTPVWVLSPSECRRIHLISAIANQGLKRFMLYRDTLSAEVLIEFLERLIREAGRKVFLVLDNLRVHHSRKVREWLEDKQDRIELIFLPSDSPELNPDEDLNADLKVRLNAGEPVRDGEHLKRKLRSHLHSLQKQPERIRSYCEAEPIRYAA
ncbi:MAG: IS630 family transposase [Anaerolineae bacterium]|nr:IS630 family transposase [Anaerolineae bacterium]